VKSGAREIVEAIERRRPGGGGDEGSRCRVGKIACSGRRVYAKAVRDFAHAVSLGKADGVGKFVSPGSFAALAM
jgi:hypothetical protein